MPDLHELTAAVEVAAEEIRALREQQAADQAGIRTVIRRRTRVLACLLVAVLLVGLGVSGAGFLFSRNAFCGFFTDLQPSVGQAQPTGEYGRRVLVDARTTADRLHC